MQRWRDHPIIPSGPGAIVLDWRYYPVVEVLRAVHGEPSISSRHVAVRQRFRNTVFPCSLCATSAPPALTSITAITFIFVLDNQPVLRYRPATIITSYS